ncbi:MULTISPECIES: FkbM family methyltransferase [Thalassobaculum]|uniref:Methyltransferase, FkbM family n=1 Tax=Thalassobaculum litoreum DSM 18839 TaxID=1123362 RepID=A0A8G2F021_9PROT|nr:MULTISPECIES: FkbM family methyltransferase [Thalassobaculum]SDG47426.1 methyltransferase, FkbM family [Thalassobaculum litoreum DSM 18839]
MADSTTGKDGGAGDKKAWPLDWALHMFDTQNAAEFRRQAVEDPHQGAPLIGATWPPRTRVQLLASSKRIRHALVLRASGLVEDPGQIQYLIRAVDRVRQLIEFFQRREKRWHTKDVWSVTAPNGQVIRFPMTDPAADMFKKIVEEYGGHYERALITFLNDRLGPGDVFVDIGAHTGYISAFAATTGCTVFALEIQRNLMPLLEQLATINAFDHLRPLYLGASSKSGLSLMRRGWTTPAAQLEGATHTDLLGDPDSILNDYVPTITLDAAFNDDDLMPKIIKIDAEGHEADILEGARSIIEKRRTIFVIEYHSSEHMASFKRRGEEVTAQFDRALWDLGQLTDEGVKPISGPQDIIPDARDSHPKIVLTPKMD